MTDQSLTTAYPLISEQITPKQLGVVLARLQEALERCDGAVVEFGCYIGTTSLFIRRLLDNRHDPRAFHVYDSFEGLPVKTAKDESRAGDQFKAGELAVTKKQFLLEFKKANLRPPHIHKGWFNQLTNADVPQTIAFAFLDGDFYESIIDSWHLVWPHMQPGSVIIVDDYSREALPGAGRAVDELLAQNPGHRLQVINNQAIIYV